MIDDATQQAKPSLTLPSPPQPSFPAFITASGIDRFLACPASALLTWTMRKTSQAALQGTLEHEARLQDGKLPPRVLAWFGSQPRYEVALAADLAVDHTQAPLTEQQQEAWIYTWERIALVQTILNGGAAALVAALKAEESYMLRQIYDDITSIPPSISLQDACQNMCDKAKHLNISIWFDYCGVALWATPTTEPQQLAQLYANKQRTTYHDPNHPTTSTCR